MSNLEEPLLIQEDPSRKKDRYFQYEFLENTLLTWVSKIIQIGNSRPFQQHFHHDLREEDHAKAGYQRLKESWCQHSGEPDPLTRSLFFAFKNEIYRGLALQLVSGLFKFSQPLFIAILIAYAQSEDKTVSDGVFIVFLMGLTRILGNIVSAHAHITPSLTGIKFNFSVDALIYDKCLRYSLLQNTDHSVGSILNYMESDSAKLGEAFQFLGMILVVPIKFLIGIAIIYSLIGFYFVPIVVMAMIVSGINYRNGQRYAEHTQSYLEKRDERLKLTQEVFGGIRQIKMTASEGHFITKVTQVRNEELIDIKRSKILVTIQIFFAWITPVLMSVAGFGLYAYAGYELSAEKIFITLGAFDVIKVIKVYF